MDGRAGARWHAGPVTVPGAVTPPPAAVLYAKDVDRVSGFYAAVAGLVRTDRGEGHVVLTLPGPQAGAWELIVHAIPVAVAEGIHLTSPPQRREDAVTKLVFPVADLARARWEAARVGGVVDPAEREWSWSGVRACDGHDPEGSVFQVRLADGTTA